MLMTIILNTTDTRLIIIQNRASQIDMSTIHMLDL